MQDQVHELDCVATSTNDSCLFSTWNSTVSTKRMRTIKDIRLVSSAVDIIKNEKSRFIVGFTKYGIGNGHTTCIYNWISLQCYQLRISPFLPVYPSCLQTTAASLLSQWSSQTRPHRPAIHTSTPPILSERSPPLNLTSLSVHSVTHWKRNVEYYHGCCWKVSDYYPWLVVDRWLQLQGLNIYGCYLEDTERYSPQYQHSLLPW